MWLVMAALLTSLAKPVFSQTLSIGPPAPTVDPARFRNPPPQYRPVVSITEGSAATLPMEEAARRALLEDGAGSIMFSPQGDPTRKRPNDLSALVAVRPLGSQSSYPEDASPWLMKALPGEAGIVSFVQETRSALPAPTAPPPSLGFMTPRWFAAADSVLKLARQNGRFATFYDETGFPSGSADHTIPEKYYRKILRREELTVSGYQTFSAELPASGNVVALIALNTRNGERVDLGALVKNGRVEWKAPAGNWRVQKYFITTANSTGSSIDYHGTADFLDPEASGWFIDQSYARVFDGLGKYFGNPINMSFFDDVGIYPEEKTWHPAIAARFEKITGRRATTYYPALWEDIGPETAAARVGFFKARAELLGEGFPKLVTDWTSQHGIQSSGHTPGNYDIQPTDMNGDPFKFYAYTAIPMADVIFGHGFGRDGFKLISSVSSQRDLPITAAETFTATNSDRGYRRLIELYVRGINRFVTGWRRAVQPRGTPAEFNEWAGRASLLLQGGRHVADIAVLYPIASLQAFYSFDAQANSAKLPSGTYVYRDADYLAVGEMLVSSLHRDFTFIHPDALGSDKLRVEGTTLVMANKVNQEDYRVVVMPGGEVLSVKALKKIRQFYDAGGAVIATSLLPSRSAEFGQDAEVRSIISEMFGSTAEQTTPSGAPQIRRSAGGGQAVFIRHPDPATLESVMTRLGLTPDVSFQGNPAPTSGNGVFGYLHKQKEGKDIYFFGNSSDEPIDTVVTLRGRLERPQLWNPHNGMIVPAGNVSYRKTPAGDLTEIGLKVGPISSVFVIGSNR